MACAKGPVILTHSPVIAYVSFLCKGSDIYFCNGSVIVVLRINTEITIEECIVPMDIICPASTTWSC